MSLLLALALAAAIDVRPPESHKNLVGFMDGAGLQRHCEDSGVDTPGLRDVCLGYLAGAVDQMFAMVNARPTAEPILCDVSGLNLEEVRLNVLTFLKANPSATRNAGAHVVIGALMAAHPCPGKPKPPQFKLP
jgi:hypothetical protein